MCNARTVAVNLIDAYAAAYADASPIERRAALAAIYALRQVTAAQCVHSGDATGTQAGTIGAACALPRPAEEAQACLA